MGLKGKLKIILTGSFLGLLIQSNAQQERISLPEKFSLADSVKLPEIRKISFENLLNSRLMRAGYLYSGSWIQQPEFLKASAGLPVSAPGSRIAPDFITRQWGIFCEGEWQLEKKTRIPLRLRLGSLEYVNHLEGK